MASKDGPSTSKAAKRSAPSHPPWLQMVVEAVKNCEEKKGASTQFIKTFIMGHYPAVNPDQMKYQVKKALEKGLDQELLKRPKSSEEAIGMTGRFKFNKTKAKEPAKTDKTKATKKKADDKDKTAKKKAATPKKAAAEKGTPKKKATTKKGPTTPKPRKKLTKVEVKTPKRPKSATAKSRATAAEKKPTKVVKSKTTKTKATPKKAKTKS